jgi:hypothetical protein
MIDLYQTLILFLAVVCAPPDTAEVGIFEEGGRSRYLVREDGKWKDYKYGTVHEYTLKISEKKDGEGKPQKVYEGVARIGSDELIMTSKYSIPAGVFADPKGTFLIPLRGGDDSIVLRKYEEGIDIDSPHGRSVHIRWKKR